MNRILCGRMQKFILIWRRYKISEICYGSLSINKEKLSNIPLKTQIKHAKIKEQQSVMLILVELLTITS
jgi:hypothetical protein